MTYTIYRTYRSTILGILTLFAICFASCTPYVVRAANTRTITDGDLPTTNVNSTETNGKSAFKIVACDGPDLSMFQKMNKDASGRYSASGEYLSNPEGYIPCDWNGLIIQVQHIINIMMVLGVLGAVASSVFVGYLFVTGKEADRTRAKAILPMVVKGFVIMLTAWFIVYQILDWLTGNSAFTTLLGNP